MLTRPKRMKKEMKLQSDIDNMVPEQMKEQKTSTFKKVLKLVGLLLGISLLYVFVRNSNLDAIWTQLSTIGWKFIFLIGVSFVSYFLVTVAWRQSFLDAPRGVGIMHLFVLRLIGESLAQINPTNVIAGDTLKAVMLRRKGVPYQSSVVSLTISRFLIILSSVALMAIGVYIFLDHIQALASQHMIVIMTLTVVAILLILLSLLHTGKGIFGLPVRIMNSLFPHSEKVQAVAENLKLIDEELLEFYRRKKLSFFSAFWLSFFHRITGAGEFYVILLFLGIDISFFSCVAIEIGVMVFKALGSFIPGQIGIEEYGNKVMLGFVNVPGSEIWITVSILRRARQIFWIGLGVILFSLMIGRKSPNPVMAEQRS